MPTPYASPIQGARLQVRYADAARGLALLRELGVPFEEVHEASPLYEQLERLSEGTALTKKAPLGKRLFTLSRVVLFAVVVLAAALLIHAYITRDERKKARLCQEWCVTEILSDGEPADISTEFREGVFIMRRGGCPEIIHFGVDRLVELPGLHSPPIVARWRFDGDSVRISLPDSTGAIYNGGYAYEIKGIGLTLRNARTFISATQY